MNPEIDVNEVIEELDPLGKALFDAALGRVRLRKALARIDELERQRETSGAGEH